MSFTTNRRVCAGTLAAVCLMGLLMLAGGPDRANAQSPPPPKSEAPAPEALLAGAWPQFLGPQSTLECVAEQCAAD